VAQRVRELRDARGWSARALADQLADIGFPQLNRSTVASIESGRRSYVTVDEVLAFAVVFHVSPNALIFPSELSEEVALTPTTSASAESAWRWATGDTPLPGELPAHPQGQMDINQWWEAYGRPRQEIRNRFRAENRPYAQVGDSRRVMLGFNREFSALEQARLALLDAGASPADVAAYFEEAMEDYRARAALASNEQTGT